ncbi:hypothetical protein NHF46_19350 [Arthrobacter alpinus]|nr:hypothetical protein [Arthrobacter alpinus]
MGTPDFPGGAAFLTAGLGMFAATFLLAARRYPALAWRFQAVAALGGLVTLGIGLIAVFSEHLFTKLLYNPANYQMNSNPLQWYTVFALTAVQLMILGPVILALVVALRPAREGAPAPPHQRPRFGQARASPQLEFGRGVARNYFPWHGAPLRTLWKGNR